MFMFISPNLYAAPEVKSKFYDFNDQIIDGQIKKPTTLYTDARDKVKFDRLIDGEVKQPTALYMDTRQEVKFQRLLKLKRNFLGDNLWKTARDKVFK